MSETRVQRSVTGPKPSKVRKRLRHAMVDHTLVRIERSIDRADTLDGFVVGVGEQWLLLHWLDQRIHLDGFVALRIADVERIEDKRAQAFVRRALERRGDWPPFMPIPRTALDDTQTLLAALADDAPLLSIFTELDEPGRCYIGVLEKTTKKSVRVRGITPDAQWIDEPRTWKLATITRIEVGDGYLEALHDVGGPPPRSAA